MEQISNEEFLKLQEEDLLIEDYDTDFYYAEAKLKCGLYVYWSGHDDEIYNGHEFAFAGSVKNLIVMKNSYKSIVSKNDKMIFTTNYLKHCGVMKKLDDMDPIYLQMEKLAKNIIKESEGSILFYELKSYTFNALAKYEEEINRKIEKIYDLDMIKAIVNEMINEMKTEQYYSDPKLDSKNELPKDK